MAKHDLLSDWKFLGKKVQRLLALDFIVGISWFAIESSFLIVLQGFLLGIGIFSFEQARLPAWYPQTFTANLFLLLAFGVLRASLTMFKNFFSIYSCQAFIGEKRQKFLEGALLRRHEFSNQEIVGSFSEVVAQAGNYVINLSHFVQAATTATLFLLLCLWVAPFEAFIGLCLLSILIYPLKIFTREISTYGENILHNWQSVNKILLNGLKNVFFLRLHQMLGEEVRRGQEAVRGYEQNFRRYAWSSSFVLSLPQLAGIVVICVVAWSSQRWIKTDSLVLVSFLYLFIRLAQAASQANTYRSYLKLTRNGFEELRDKFFGRFERYPEIQQNKRLLEGSASGVNISVVGLTCAYDLQKPLFTDLNFILNKSQMLLVKGPSGVGKSTLLKALVGDLAPMAGDVFYNKMRLQDGYNIAPLIGYVGPEPFLIHATVRENLLYGNLRENISNQEIWHILDRLGLKAVVEGLPANLEEVLREETQLSAGQKQRLAMARALLRQPRLLILDEATANIDSETERMILSYLKGIKNDITTFVISHKDSFDELADEKINLETN